MGKLLKEKSFILSSFVIIKIKLLFILVLFTSNLYGFSYTLEISQDELQKKVEKRFPVKKQNLFFTTLVSNPKVKLKKQLNKIDILFDLNVIASKELNFNTSAILSGTVLYKADEKSIYFKDLSLVKLDLKEIPLEFHEIIKVAIEIGISNYIKEHPIYKIEDKDIKSKLLKALVKDVKIKDEKILIELSY